MRLFLLETVWNLSDLKMLRNANFRVEQDIYLALVVASKRLDISLSKLIRDTMVYISYGGDIDEIIAFYNSVKESLICDQ